MAGTVDLHRVIADARRVGAKVILVGDHHQLPEVNAGGVFTAAVNTVQAVSVIKAASGTFTLTFNGQTTAAIPYAGSAAVAVGAATESGNTVTITTSAAHNFVVGQTVVIAGITPTGYNGTFTITSVPTPTTFTYTNPTSGLAASTVRSSVPPEVGAVMTVLSATSTCLSVPLALSARR